MALLTDVRDGREVIDPGLAVDLIAAIAAGDAVRQDIGANVDALREVAGVGEFASARRVRTELLDFAGGTTGVLNHLEIAWSSARTALTDSAWSALAADPTRWRGQFVAERLNSTVPIGTVAASLSGMPPSRFYTFGDLGPAAGRNALHIPGEDVTGLTPSRIESGLEGAVPEMLICCAARWRYLGWSLARSVEPVGRIVDDRCDRNDAVLATGVAYAVDVTRQVAAQWNTIGNAAHSFALGLRRAQTAIRGLQSERAALITQSENNFETMVRRPVLEEALQRRARTDFSEAYGAGLFAFVAAMRSAGEPPFLASESRDG